VQGRLVLLFCDIEALGRRILRMTDEPTERLRIADDEMIERIRERLAANPLGSGYAEHLVLVSAAGVVAVGGFVDDLDVQDHILGIVSSVTGARDVRDHLRLPE
jgi:osmotically-inducible protein OsmY